MSNDFLIRNSLYGFKKEDVISYIEKIKKECQHHKDVAQNSEDNLNEANKKIALLEEKLKKLDEQLTNKENKSQMVEVKVNKKSKCNEDINDLKNENDILKIQNENLTKECEKFKKSNKEVNTLILDAYIHSEGILNDAKDKAQQIASSTQNIINATAGDIEDFSDYVNNISTDFSQIVSELTCNIKNLTGNLISATKGIKEPTKEKSKENEILESFEDLISKYVNSEDASDVNVDNNDSNITESNPLSSLDISSENVKNEKDNVQVEEDILRSNLNTENTKENELSNNKIIAKIDEYITNNLKAEDKDKKINDKNEKEVKTTNKIKVKIRKNKNFEE